MQHTKLKKYSQCNLQEVKKCSISNLRGTETNDDGQKPNCKRLPE